MIRVRHLKVKTECKPTAPLLCAYIISSSGLSSTVSAQSRLSVLVKGSLGCLSEVPPSALILSRRSHCPGRAREIDLPRRSCAVVVVLMVRVMVVGMVGVVRMMGRHPAAAGQALRAEVAAVGGVPRVGVLAAGLQVAHLVGEGLVHHVGRGAAPRPAATAEGPAAGRS